VGDLLEVCYLSTWDKVKIPILCITTSISPKGEGISGLPDGVERHTLTELKRFQWVGLLKPTLRLCELNADAVWFEKRSECQEQSVHEWIIRVECQTNHASFFNDDHALQREKLTYPSSDASLGNRIASFEMACVWVSADWELIIC